MDGILTYRPVVYARLETYNKLINVQISRQQREIILIFMNKENKQNRQIQSHFEYLWNKKLTIKYISEIKMYSILL